MEKYVAITDHQEVIHLGSFDSGASAEAQADSNPRTAGCWLFLLNEQQAEEMASDLIN